MPSIPAASSSQPSRSPPRHRVFSPPRDRKCSTCAASSSMVPAGPTKGRYRFSPTTPPLSRMARNISSVRLRRWGHRARLLEWVATTGPRARRTTSQNPGSLMWDTSGQIWHASSCRRKSVPRGERPRSVSRQLVPDRTLGQFHTGLRNRTPHSAAVSTCPGSQPMNSAPSMERIAAIFPSAAAQSTSAPVRQGTMTSRFCSISCKNRR